ncbi:MAG: DUF1501 domain-containing protein [Chlorobi bacterium]|nr:DUF1501 domain-containing protein [Chlorobiota bacterium]
MKRRDFITKAVPTGVAATTLPFLMDGASLKAYASSPLFAQLAAAAQTDRVLVVLFLDGGNDGLNTVIPRNNPAYFNARPNLGIKNSLPINDTLGFHPKMTGFDTLYKDGRIAIVQNVGYERQNRSHFRSTDIWFTASDSTEVLSTGWLGRYLAATHPDYPDVFPDHPLAIQIGSTLSLTFQGPKSQMGLAITDPEQFYNLIQGTDISGGDPPPDTPAGHEVKFIRGVALEAFTYAGPIRDAANNATNQVQYPNLTTGGNLPGQLQIVARMIAGGLTTPVYMVRIGGFDTHANEDTRHPVLLEAVSQSVEAFMQDLKALGVEDRVLIMTMSEFGRRTKENGSKGTDHGSAAPHFLISPKVRGGIYGHDPDFSNVDRSGDFIYQYDFRQIYASILEQWFGVPGDIIKQALLRDFATIPMIESPPVGVDDPAFANGFVLEQNYPNPFNPTTRIFFNTPGGKVRLTIHDESGRIIQTLVNDHVAPGRHEVTFKARNLASGTYFYRLESNGFKQTKAMTLVR